MRGGVVGIEQRAERDLRGEVPALVGRGERAVSLGLVPGAFAAGA